MEALLEYRHCLTVGVQPIYMSEEEDLLLVQVELTILKTLKQLFKSYSHFSLE